MYHEGLGKLHFWLMLIGFNVTFFPMHWVGIEGMPRRIYTYDSGYGWEVFNLISTLGVFVLALGFVVFIVDAGSRSPWARRLQPIRGTAQPWSGRSHPRRRSTTSPASRPVTSRIPYWSRSTRRSTATTTISAMGRMTRSRTTKRCTHTMLLTGTAIATTRSTCLTLRTGRSSAPSALRSSSLGSAGTTAIRR